MCYRHSPLLQSITFLLCVHAKSLKLCLTLCDPVDCVACQAPLSMGFFRWEHWSGFSFPPSGDLTDRGIKLPPLMSPALAGSFFITSAPLEAHIFTLVLWRKKKEDIHVYHFIFLQFISDVTYQNWSASFSISWAHSFYNFDVFILHKFECICLLALRQSNY